VGFLRVHAEEDVNSSLEPATAVVLGVVLLDEPLAMATIVGSVLVLVGVIVIQME
jgi:drug/metabolite transporter (DMT)-like permease